MLLIDEIDRADEEFEAFLLEVLSDFQITIPELGTIEAKSRPIVVLTANGTRDLSDALRRRCIYSFVPYPDRETELAVLAKRGPEISPQLSRQIVGFVQSLRKEDLEKKPGIAETLDWAAALAGLGLRDLTDDPVALRGLTGDPAEDRGRSCQHSHRSGAAPGWRRGIAHHAAGDPISDTRLDSRADGRLHASPA